MKNNDSRDSSKKSGTKSRSRDKKIDLAIDDSPPYSALAEAMHKANETHAALREASSTWDVAEAMRQHTLRQAFLPDESIIRTFTDFHRSTRNYDFLSAYSDGSNALDSKYDGLFSDSLLPSSETASLRKEKAKLQAELADQWKKFEKLRDDLSQKEEDLTGKEATIEQYKEERKSLLEKEKFSHLLNRVNEIAQKRLFDEADFRSLFEAKQVGNVVVMAIDIRRSTELMLKAKNPELFSVFITSLCSALSQIIKARFGVFDKFTGDGILAFFPDFYSGKDAISWALSAAQECHDFFEAHYRKHRNSFTSVLKDVGLGIGIDSGTAHLVNVSGELTVVGVPVVYACRMSGASAGVTLLNQPAFEAAHPDYSEFYQFEETDHEIKHEGRIVAHRLVSVSKTVAIDPPTWARL